MKIELVLKKLIMHLDHKNIKTLEYAENGNLKVIDRNDNVISSFPTPCSIAFNKQYSGTPISNDGKYVFIGVWYKGLYCFNLQSGELKWKQGPGKVRNIIVYQNKLFIEMANRGLVVRDINNGEIIDNIKMSAIDIVKQISQDETFVGPKYGTYYVYKLPDLKVIHKIQLKKLNFNRCLSYVITDVFYKDDVLMIKGAEQYKEYNYNNKEEVVFERSVPVK